jgi:hypothetical protein
MFDINSHPLPGTGEVVFFSLGNVCQLASFFFFFFFQTGENEFFYFHIFFLIVNLLACLLDDHKSCHITKLPE